MNPLRSIRGRLTCGVTIAAMVMIISSEWFIYHKTRANTFALVDRALIEHAQLLSRQVEFEEGVVRLEHGEWLETDVGGEAFGAFRLWTSDGTGIVQFPELDESVFPRFAAPGTEDGVAEFRNLELPGHEISRAVSIRFLPMFETDSGRTPPPPDMRVNIAIAHDISAAMAGLEQLRWLLITVGLVACAALGILIQLLIRGALRPLEAVKNELAARGNSDLAANVSGEGTLPSELKPVVAGFNTLLGRIRRVSEREREFTSSAAHELRTPIAALTSILEHSASRQRSSDELREVINVSLETTRDMNALVERLLTLARYDRPGVEMEIANVPLGILVDGAVETFAETAASRNLDFVYDLPEGLEMSTDPALAQVVINNLTENAVNYAAEGTRIHISAMKNDKRVRLSFRNQADNALVTDVEKIFEPFWRADQVRSRPGLHAGLGLSICQKITDAIGGVITAEADETGMFSIAVDFPATDAEH